MSLVDVLAAGLPVTMLVNWPVFLVCAYVARRHPGIRTLVDRRWVSLGIAVSSTALTIVAIAYFGHLSLGSNVLALLFSVPIYLLTAVNTVFAYLTWKGDW